MNTIQLFIFFLVSNLQQTQVSLPVDIDFNFSSSPDQSVIFESSKNTNNNTPPVALSDTVSLTEK